MCFCFPVFGGIDLESRKTDILKQFTAVIFGLFNYLITLYMRSLQSWDIWLFPNHSGLSS